MEKQEISQEKSEMQSTNKFTPNTISEVIKDARETVQDSAQINIGRNGEWPEGIHKNPDDLLEGISDIILNSKLAVNYMSKKDKGKLK